jgi:hypothetical protein
VEWIVTKLSLVADRDKPLVDSLADTLSVLLASPLSMGGDETDGKDRTGYLDMNWYS